MVDQADTVTDISGNHTFIRELEYTCQSHLLRSLGMPLIWLFLFTPFKKWLEDC